MATWFAYQRKDTGSIGFVSDDSQGFAQVQADANLTLTVIPRPPLPTEHFDTVQKTLVTNPAPVPTADQTLHAALIAQDVSIAGFTGVQLAQAIQLILKKMVM